MSGNSAWRGRERVREAQEIVSSEIDERSELGRSWFVAANKAEKKDEK